MLSTKDKTTAYTPNSKWRCSPTDPEGFVANRQAVPSSRMLYTYCSYSYRMLYTYCSYSYRVLYTYCSYSLMVKKI